MIRGMERLTKSTLFVPTLGRRAWRVSSSMIPVYRSTPPPLPCHDTHFPERKIRCHLSNAVSFKGSEEGGRNFNSEHQRRTYSTTVAEYKAEHERSVSKDTRDSYWLDYARENIHWYREPTIGLDESSRPFYKWFPDGVTNLCYNAVDRWVLEEREGGESVAGGTSLAAQTAVAYESAMGGASREITFKALKEQVSRFAGALMDLGVNKGDRVLIYMPMIPDSLVAMLACNRIGAVHSVVFGGFASHELAVRLNDATPKVVVTATCGIEPGKGEIAYWPLLEGALALSDFVPEHVVMKKRSEASVQGPPSEVEIKSATSTSTSPPSPPCVVHVHDFDEVSSAAKPQSCIPLLASDPLYILYTSGTTGLPKGILRDNSHSVALR